MLDLWSYHHHHHFVITMINIIVNIMVIKLNTIRWEVSLCLWEGGATSSVSRWELTLSSGHHNLGNLYTKNCGLNAKFENCIFKDNPSTYICVGLVPHVSNYQAEEAVPDKDILATILDDDHPRGALHDVEEGQARRAAEGERQIRGLLQGHYQPHCHPIIKVSMMQ